MLCNFAKIVNFRIFSDITLTSHEASILTSVTQLGFPIGGKSEST